MSGPSLIAELGLDGRGYEKGLKSASDKTANFAQHVHTQIGGALSGIASGNPLMGLAGRFAGGLGIGKLLMEAKAASDEVAGKANDVRIGTLRTGLDTDTFQRIKNSLESMDAPMDSFTTFMDHVAQKQELAKEGGEEGAKAMKLFATIGASSNDVLGKSYQDLSVEIFRFLKGVELTGDKVAALKEIGGRGAMEIVPGAQVGMDSAVAGKGILSEEDVKKATEIKKEAGETAAYWADYRRDFAKVFYDYPIKKPWKAMKDFFPGIGNRWGGGTPLIKETRINAEMEQFRDKDAERLKKQTDEEELDREEQLLEDGYQKEKVAILAAEQAKEKKQAEEYSHATAVDQYRLEQQMFAIREKALSATEKETALRKEMNDHLEKAKVYKDTGFMDLEATDELNLAAEKGAALADLFNSQKLPPTSDSLSRIGGFTGGSGSAQNLNAGIHTKVEGILNALKSGIVIKGEN